ncbi:hypothetical protein F2P81_000775 [Scophthalmus maximus]|uniref:Uncharacterized protein n=1 Tax=Scophthalmus maximus TaxID=52904 RepID=A0A6A4TYN7_SCOMX|nr:hypothetical protein F2P81_000775 [Scophthalmus maximus]
MFCPWSAQIFATFQFAEKFLAAHKQQDGMVQRRFKGPQDFVLLHLTPAVTYSSTQLDGLLHLFPATLLWFMVMLWCVEKQKYIYVYILQSKLSPFTEEQASLKRQEVASGFRCAVSALIDRDTTRFQCCVSPLQPDG